MHGLPKNSDVALIIKWAWSRAFAGGLAAEGAYVVPPSAMGQQRFSRGRESAI